MKPSSKTKTGFSLLEVLIAITILSIGLVSVFSLFPIGVYAVKDTVEGTRGAALSKTARAELAATRADMRILDSGSPGYGSTSGFVPFGPWECPAHLWVFRSPLFQYVDSPPPPASPALHNRIVFDDRTMIPITLKGSFDGSNTVTVLRTSLTRDSDLLELYYQAAAGANKYDPWEIYLRVRGKEYQIMDRTYHVAAPDRDLATLVLRAGATPPPGAAGAPVVLPFEILLPVALKEPPVSVPQEWAGGVADFDGLTPGPFAIPPAYESRNLAEYLVDRVGAGYGGWISVEGDWYQVDTVIPAVGMPTSVSVDGTQPVPPDTPGLARFDLPLPVVTFNNGPAFFDDGGTPADPADDTQELSLVAGGGPQLGFLESGASIEIVLDGATGNFDPSNATGRTVVLNVTDVNSDTSPFILAGDFIRIEGRDYEIARGLYDADGVGGNNDFRLVGTVPSYGSKYFHIVLGYDPTPGNQVPGVARFPVRKVTRTVTAAAPAKLPYPVTSFKVGRDVNGNLPRDLWPAGAPDPFDNPVHILPANRTRFSYQVIMSQKSPLGTFTNGSQNVDAPDPATTPTSTDIPAIPYPPTLDSTVMTLNSNIFQLRTLSKPDSTGVAFSENIQDVQNSPARLILTAAATFDSNVPIPLHAYDENDFDTALNAGTGTFNLGLLRVDFPPAPPGSMTEDAIFLAPGVSVRLDGPGGRFAVTQVATVHNSLDWFTVSGGGTLQNGDTVTVTIVAAGAGARNRTWGRGYFVRGSDVIMGVYNDTAGAFAGIPGRAFPYSTVAPQRYHLAVGDYIQAPDNKWYAVKAIHDVADPAKDVIILDRPYRGPTSAVPADGDYFRYVTPIQEAYTAQVAVFANYRLQQLGDDDNTDGQGNLAAAFGFDVTGAVDDTKVHLAVALPPGIKPGDHIRADGDANHPDDPGLSDLIDGDRRWYMIQSIQPDDPTDPNYRREITLTSPYRGYIPAAETFQPASVSPSVIRTYDTVIGAF